MKFTSPSSTQYEPLNHHGSQSMFASRKHFLILVVIFSTILLAFHTFRSTTSVPQPSQGTDPRLKVPAVVQKLVQHVSTTVKTETVTSPTAAKTTTEETITFSVMNETKTTSNVSKPERITPAVTIKKNVTIYAATKWFTQDITKAGFMEQCSEEVRKWCKLSTDPADLPTADAVLFHNTDFNQSMFPKNRNLSQFYVMLTAESPMNQEINFEPHQINWTMNYRRDADVFHPFSIWKKRDQPQKVDYEALWKAKNESVTVSWMVANCHSQNKRWEIVQKAKQQGLQIDTYGGCGQAIPNCDRYIDNRYDCAAEILKKYKFYIAFENSICPDYVTEKIYNAHTLYDSIPIVLTRKIYENRGIPGNSFIALDDFVSVESMVAFLNKLKDNKGEYLKYFKWRVPTYATREDDSIRFCGLCNKLQAGNNPTKSYADLKKWYSRDTCNNGDVFKYVE